MKGWKIGVVIVGGPLALLVICHRAGRLLVKEDPLVRTDAALVFSGDPDYERTLEAARLYREGWVRKVILTGHGYGGDDALDMKEVAVKKGVRSRDIFLENASTSTYTNLLLTKGIVTSHGFTTVTLVSSPYHMKRIWTLTQKIYGHDRGGNVVRFFCRPVRKSIWSPDGWWKSAQGRRPVIQEYGKLIAFWLLGVLDQNDGGILWKAGRAG